MADKLPQVPGNARRETTKNGHLSRWPLACQMDHRSAIKEIGGCARPDQLGVVTGVQVESGL
jgi:hypothetical protein